LKTKSVKYSKNSKRLSKSKAIKTKMVKMRRMMSFHLRILMMTRIALNK
jgi:hypothetical protein